MASILPGPACTCPRGVPGTVLEVELPALRATRTIRVGGKVQGLSVPRVGGTLFVANEDGWLDVIRLSTGARLARLDFGSRIRRGGQP